jgi:L-alanine-DL-glutamate epimerase-like enolase superfamily enzyme
MLLEVVEVRAVGLSVDLRDRPTTLGVGTAVKKDTVVVRVRTEDGIVGYGEAHHALAVTVVADLVNYSLAPLVVGEDALAVEHIWNTMYQSQGRTHSTGWGIWKAMSGIDMALWDVRGKALGLPVWRLLGGVKRRLRAYAGGVSLGWQAPEALAEEAQSYVARGFTALKLRGGESVERDLARVRHVRHVLGERIDLMIDMNTRYGLADLLRALPGLEECGVYWIEEPFPPDAVRDYALAAGRTRIPLAAGENHFLRYQARQLLETEAVHILQPDASKAGGVTETKKIADLAAAFRRPFAPHTSMSGLNAAATLHLLSACPNALVYEADVAPRNPFRDELTSPVGRVGPDGCVEPPDGPGLGVEVDEAVFARYPLIAGPCYV